MCFCDLYSKKFTYSSGLSKLGQGMEATLHFLCELVLLLCGIRLLVNWIFSI